MNTPTLINLPPPPSETPTDFGPGTPNSGTTSLSALSVVAVKDGHQGHTTHHGHHHHNPRDSMSSTTTLDAERADRISRLAGLERVATVRPGHGPGVQGAAYANPPPGYFDNLAPHIKERSTVGSASATGSVGGRTTWASGSVDNDVDKMSEDQDDGSSQGGLSDEGNASLVGFGEGAGSTISGPISTATARALAARYNAVGSPSVSRTNTASGQILHRSTSPMSGIVTSGGSGNTDPKHIDGMAYDADTVDTTMQTGPHAGLLHQHRQNSGAGTEFAERVMRDRLTDGDGHRALGSPDERNQALGKFSFEKE